MKETRKEEKIYYTPKEVAYSTGFSYTRILRALKSGELVGQRDTKNKSYLIEESSVKKYLALLKDPLKGELCINFKSKVPKNKLKDVTEELIKSFNKVKTKYSIPISLNIESK